ncbi:MAG: Gmad2 immunoglobulin-like domain-containing protein, partial [Spirochaetaceae bacterium]|nr:Gmad2 immunoglobulin-like domain-containing protein [Spirochaetaceae bacterium]
DWSEPVARAPMLDVQGLIWVLAPTQDASVASPVTISGVGTAFEATISWQVRREGSDAVVAEGFTSGGANGEFGEFTDTVELEPGTYELRAFESSAEDGRPLHVDSKTFTVE